MEATSETWVKAYTEDGTVVERPDEEQVRQMVSSLGTDNGFLILERQGGPTGFAQTAVPRGEGEPWVIEYREGANHYQAFTEDLDEVIGSLVRYSQGSQDLVSDFQWKLLMTHSD